MKMRRVWLALLVLAGAASVEAQPVAPARGASNTVRVAPQPNAPGAGNGGAQEGIAELLKTRRQAVQKVAEQLTYLCDGMAPNAGIAVLRSPDAQDLKDLCSHVCSPQSGVNVCALRDPVPAAAAVASDWDMVLRLVTHIRRTVADAQTAHSSLAGVTRASAVVAATDAIVSGNESGVPTLGTMSSQVLEVGMAALARLIQDRARREAIGWLLDQVGTYVCGGDDLETAHLEIREHWFPALCGLAEREDLVEYGAGGRLLTSLRGAVEEDIRGWPGAAAGLAGGAGFWLEARENVGDSMFSCPAVGGGTRSRECTALVQLRGALERFVDRLVSGGEPSAGFAELGTAIHDLNVYVDDGTNVVHVHSIGFELGACAMAFPDTFREYQQVLAGGGLSLHQGSEAAALVALTTTPACWALVGKGHISTNYDPAAPGASEVAIGKYDSRERITTIIRLYGVATSVANRLTNSSERLRNAFATYRQRLQELAEVEFELPEVPSLDGVEVDADSADDLLAAVHGYLRAGSALELEGAAQAVFTAAVAIAEATFDLARSAVAVLRTVMLDQQLMPGLWKIKEVKDLQLNTVREKLEQRLSRFDTMVDHVSRATGSLVALVESRWDLLVARVQGLLSELAQGTGNTRGNLQRILGRYTRLFVAIVTETDPDALAETLDDAAEPVGGWRRKGTADFILSITAHPGLFAGGELRWGPYGDRYERGAAYGVAPALTFPLGLEFSFGTESWIGSPIGLFVSVLDPLAYLQYDASQGADLPAPQLITVFAPGLGIRLGFRNTPFSIMPWATYRPGLRAETRGVSGEGASVFQVGIAVTVDVTLWELFVKGADR